MDTLDEQAQYRDPRTVPDFHRYVTHVGMRPVPATRPARVPGYTANQMFFGWALAWFVAIVVFIPVMKLDFPLASVLVPASGFGWFAICLWWLRRTADRNAEEWAQGYTTLVIQLGSLWMSLNPRIAQLRGSEGSVEWDYSALWVLKSNGEVVSPPKKTGVVQPGFYPSPHKENRLELWTGKEWGEVYKKEREFFGVWE